MSGWKHAAKLLFNALQKSRRRCRRLQCRLDDVIDMDGYELRMRAHKLEELLVENQKLRMELNKP